MEAIKGYFGHATKVLASNSADTAVLDEHCDAVSM